MTSAAHQVYEQALELSSQEREQLIDALARSLGPVTLTPAWQAEIARRFEKAERGEAAIHPDVREVVRRLQAKYG